MILPSACATYRSGSAFIWHQHFHYVM